MSAATKCKPATCLRTNLVKMRRENFGTIWKTSSARIRPLKLQEFQFHGRPFLALHTLSTNQGKIQAQILFSLCFENCSTFKTRVEKRYLMPSLLPPGCNLLHSVDREDFVAGLTILNLLSKCLSNKKITSCTHSCQVKHGRNLTEHLSRPLEHSFTP